MSAPVLTARVSCAVALLIGLSGCAGTRFPGTADRPIVNASSAARECRTAPSQLERSAHAAAGAVKGALMGAVGGAGIGLAFAVANPAGCVEPTTSSAYVGGMVAGGAIAFGVIGAAAGARTSWRESVARKSHVCATEPEIRSSGNSSSGEAELTHESLTRFLPSAQSRRSP
jgi:hypothetical protein